MSKDQAIDRDGFSRPTEPIILTPKEVKLVAGGVPPPVVPDRPPAPDPFYHSSDQPICGTEALFLFHHRGG
jgi:hypothetical protein